MRHPLATQKRRQTPSPSHPLRPPESCRPLSREHDPPSIPWIGRIPTVPRRGAILPHLPVPSLIGRGAIPRHGHAIWEHCDASASPESSLRPQNATDDSACSTGVHCVLPVVRGSLSLILGLLHRGAPSTALAHRTEFSPQLAEDGHPTRETALCPLH